MWQIIFISLVSGGLGVGSLGVVRLLLRGDEGTRPEESAARPRRSRLPTYLMAAFWLVLGLLLLSPPTFLLLLFTGVIPIPDM